VRGRVRFHLRFAAVVAAVCVTTTAAYSSTIPLPTGVATARVSRYQAFDDSQSYFGFVFNGVRAAGRLIIGGRGVQARLTARRMQYEATQCHNVGCAATPYFLVAPFSLTGRNLVGQPFDATCATGELSDPIADQAIGVSLLTMVSASCEGGTSDRNGVFSFRFLVPTLSLTDPPPTGIVVGPMVEA
jgi:hypothetical protein